MSESELARRVRDFWFGEQGSETYGSSRKEWFVKNPDFDNDIREKFGADVDTALEGGFRGLIENQMDALALIILLDQFPRNLFRDTARMFAGDNRALSYAKKAVRMGFDQNLAKPQQMFFYMPFEHSESLDDQLRCMDLFKAANNDDMLKWAVAHHDIIARFGRFPHRNEALGRTSTDEETAFLKEPDSSF